MPEDDLVLTFDPQTVDHLGAKMYSQLPNALAELVANAYDADAHHVLIKVESSGSISITDDGHGMSREDVRDKYLHIGRNRRATENGMTESGLRRVSGKKGLGKLALFGIGRKVVVQTTRRGSQDRVTVTLDYDQMKESVGAYHPAESRSTSTAEHHGTLVRLSELKRSTAIDPEALARSLARLFNYVDVDFSVSVEGPNGTTYPVTNALRLASIQVEFEWNFPENGGEEFPDLRDLGVLGRIVSTEKPMPQGMRGIALYIKGRLANEAEYFDASASSYAYSYLSGYLTCDYLDELDPDVIATDRRALDWGRDETAELRSRLTDLVTWIAGDWRRRRRERSYEKTRDVLGGTTDEWIESIRTPEAGIVREIVDAVESDEGEMPAEQQGQILRLVKSVVPEYAEFAWRHFHSQVQDASRTSYEVGNFHHAVEEAIKRFVTLAQKKSGMPEQSDDAVVTGSFGPTSRLRVFAPYKDQFKEATAVNVERGQQNIAQGVVAGFRNLLAHEEVELLQQTGAFTYDDCLDALSILSHLMRRLDDAELAPPVSKVS